VGPRASSDESSLCLYWESTPDFLVFQPTAQSLPGSAIPPYVALKLKYVMTSQLNTMHMKELPVHTGKLSD